MSKQILLLVCSGALLGGLGNGCSSTTNNAESNNDDAGSSEASTGSNANTGATPDANNDTGGSDTGGSDTGGSDTGASDAGMDSAQPSVFSTGPREEGPPADCAYPALNSRAFLSEAIFNQTNADNGTEPEWWLPLEFGKAGGLLRAGGMACSPVEVTEKPPTNTECFEGYDCGGCTMVIGNRTIDGQKSFYFVPDDPKDASCADWAGFYLLSEGSEVPVHACDAAFPDCACSGGGSVLLYEERFLSAADLLECTFVAMGNGHHDSCTRRYECGTGATCGATVTTRIDRETSDVSWHIGSDLKADNRCMLEAAGEVQAMECPNPPTDECESCRENCAGTPECSCAKECDPSTSQLQCSP